MSTGKAEGSWLATSRACPMTDPQSRHEQQRPRGGTVYKAEDLARLEHLIYSPVG